MPVLGKPEAPMDINDVMYGYRVSIHVREPFHRHAGLHPLTRGLPAVRKKRSCPEFVDQWEPVPRDARVQQSASGGAPSTATMTYGTQNRNCPTLSAKSKTTEFASNLLVKMKFTAGLERNFKYIASSHVVQSL